MNFVRAMISAVAALAVVSPGRALADPAKTIQVAGRVLTFLENGPTGKVVVGVVFDPAKPESLAEKNAIMAAIGSGYTAGAVTIVGRPVEAGSDAGAKVLFVTTGVNYALVAAAAKARRIITIGSDLACVRDGACVIGVSTDPTVQIVVNHKAAAAAGTSFKAAFRMMIREI